MKENSLKRIYSLLIIDDYWKKRVRRDLKKFVMEFGFMRFKGNFVLFEKINEGKFCDF